MIRNYKIMLQDGTLLRQIFHGGWISIGLMDRNHDPGDNHILFVFLKKNSKTGEYCMYNDVGILSSYWLEGLIKPLIEANKWIEKNGVPDYSKFEIKGKEGWQWGWSFKN